MLRLRSSSSKPSVDSDSDFWIAIRLPLVGVTPSTFAIRRHSFPRRGYSFGAPNFCTACSGR